MPHIHEKIDYTVTPIIIHGDRVLLVNHPRYGKWIPPGGHIELDEDPEEALLREIKEETGLNVSVLAKRPAVSEKGTKFLPAPDFMDIHEANPPHRHIGMVYIVTTNTADFVMSREHVDMKWFGLAELDDETYGLSEGIKFYCKAAIKKVGDDEKST